MNKGIHNKLSKTTKVSKRIWLTLIISAVLLGSAKADTQADESQIDSQTSSRSLKVDYTDTTPKLKQSKYDPQKNDAQQAATQAINALATAKFEKKTRDQVIAERQQHYIAKADATNKSAASSSTQNSYTGGYLEFYIYDAYSRLLEDFDYDGFFRTFSVTFDADVFGPYFGQRARVYADLYLSRDGGPWELYFTTAPFTIIDDRSDDEFEVLTTLDTGYKTQYCSNH